MAFRSAFHQALFLALSGFLLVEAQVAPPDALHQLNSSFENLSRKISPAVVKILVSGYGVVDDNGRRGVALIGRQRSLGSGVIVDPSGYIVTNAHVIQGAQRIRVLLAPRDAGSYAAAFTRHDRIPEARIVGQSTDVDLAVLKIDGKDLPTIPLAQYSKLRQGEMVLAFGSPALRAYPSRRNRSKRSDDLSGFSRRS